MELKKPVKHTPRPVVFVVPEENLPLGKSLQDIFNHAGFELLEHIDHVSPAMLSLPDIFRSKKLSALVVIDIMPLPAVGKIENPRIFYAHKLLRKNCKRSSFIAISNGKISAKHVRTLFDTTRKRKIYSYCSELTREYESGDEAIEVLKNGYYNKVEIVKHNGGLAVRKTFRRWRSICAEREIATRKGLADIPEISPIIDYGRYHITIPHYHAKYTWDKNSLAPYSMHRANIIFELLKKIWERGWAMIDCHPENFIFTCHEGVKMIDLEYACEHGEKNVNFTESWDMVGPPQAVLDDMTMSKAHTYRNIWYPAIGLSYDALTSQPPARVWQQYLHRVFFCSGKLIDRKIRRHIISARQNACPIIDGWVCLPIRKKYY